MSDSPKSGSIRGPRSHYEQRSQLLGQTVTTRAAAKTSAHAVGDLVGQMMQPIGAKHRFVSQDLIAAWPEIAGPKLAGATVPTRMTAARKAKSRHSREQAGAVLEVYADPSVAVDLDYGQSLLVERLNTYFGYHAVSRLKVVRKSMIAGRQQHGQGFSKRQQPTAEDQAAAIENTQSVADGSLREALNTLGAHILAARKQRSSL